MPSPPPTIRAKKAPILAIKLPFNTERHLPSRTEKTPSWKWQASLWPTRRSARQFSLVSAGTSSVLRVPCEDRDPLSFSFLSRVRLRLQPDSHHRSSPRRDPARRRWSKTLLVSLIELSDDRGCVRCFYIPSGTQDS